MNFLQKIRDVLYKKQYNYELLRGYFDHLFIENGELVVSGWMLHNDGPYDAIEIFMNGEPVGIAEQVERPDVAEALTHIPKAMQCGFAKRFSCKWHDEDENRIDIEACGKIHGEIKDRMRTTYYRNMYEEIPAPPKNLIERVDEIPDRSFYVLKGAQNYSEFRSILKRNFPDKQFDTILDWGSGSGRLTSFFKRYFDHKEIYACDVDEQAIAWSKENIPSVAFQTVSPFPPVPYSDNQFDLVIAFSVLTHLSREMQAEWLPEIKRILKPDGVIIATLHGKAAAKTVLSPEEFQQIEQANFKDDIYDERMNDIFPDQYYRASFQLKAYTFKEYTKWFEIVDYVEKGASKYHDIIVMRKA